MPFVSKQQLRLCYVLKKEGKNKSWNCDEWLSQTNVSSLPEYSHSTKSKNKERSRKRSKKRRSLQRSKSKK